MNALVPSLQAALEGRPLRTRLAPSPTGYLHMGHLVHALWVWDLARACGGEVLLRIEDHDGTRCRPEFTEALLQDLAQLHLLPPGPVYRQQTQPDRYRKALDTLRAAGAHLYACDCSRRDIQQRNPGSTGAELRYDGHCRHRQLNWSPGLGLRVALPEHTVRFHDLRLGWQEQTPADQCGDLLLYDRDGYVTYQWGVVVDDLAQDITAIIRGMDILESTGRQILLREMLGATQHPVWLHHPLLMDAQGRKLSKRDFDADLHTRLRAGTPPETLLAEAREWMRLAE